MDVDVDNLSLSLAETEILRAIHLRAEEGRFIGLVGPNGSGKSTLLRSIYRVLKPDAGMVSLDGRDVYSLSQREAAQCMAVVRQEETVAFDFTVRDIVMMGRAPHKPWLAADDESDRRIVDDALLKVGMSALAGRSVQTLSGGEKQRVLIARALAQEAQVLILDEPTNHLDIRYQLEILDLVKGLGMTTLAAIHDLNLAAAYCDRLYLLKMGRIVAAGTPAEVLTPDVVNTVFGVKALRITNPVTGGPYLIFAPQR